MHDITWNDDYTQGWVRTQDPRVIGVIEPDTYPSAPDCCGNALVRVEDGGGYRAPVVTALRCCTWCKEPRIAEAYAYAYRYFKDREWLGHVKADASELAERYVRLFYDVTEVQSMGGAEDWDILAFDTATLKHDLSEWRTYRDGEVYAVSYLVVPEWVEEVDDEAVEERLVEAACILGDVYGEQWAAALAYRHECLDVELPELLDI